MNNQVKEGSERAIESDLFSELTELETRDTQWSNEDSFNMIWAWPKQTTGKERKGHSRIK